MAAHASADTAAARNLCQLFGGQCEGSIRLDVRTLGRLLVFHGQPPCPDCHKQRISINRNPLATGQQSLNLDAIETLRRKSANAMTQLT
ncbi:MAG: hypothetical protein WB509_04975, partial [Acetobacteraceae bacterium]